MSGEQTKQGGNSKRKGGGYKKGGNVKQPENNEPVSLVRNATSGMAPRAILTGYYGSRGERLRHTVHDGALKMPQGALNLIDKAAEKTGISAPESYDLPGLDCVIRPCVDPEVKEFIVTELSFEKVGVPQAPSPADGDGATAMEEDNETEPKMVYVDRCKAENRTHRRAVVVTGPPTERIRGGGGDDDDSKMDVDPPESEANADTQPTEEKPSVVTGGEKEAPPQPETTPVQAPPAVLNPVPADSAANSSTLAAAAPSSTDVASRQQNTSEVAPQQPVAPTTAPEQTKNLLPPAQASTISAAPTATTLPPSTNVHATALAQTNPPAPAPQAIAPAPQTTVSVPATLPQTTIPVPMQVPASAPQAIIPAPVPAATPQRIAPAPIPQSNVLAPTSVPAPQMNVAVAIAPPAQPTHATVPTPQETVQVPLVPLASASVSAPAVHVSVPAPAVPAPAVQEKPPVSAPAAQTIVPAPAPAVQMSAPAPVAQPSASVPAPAPQTSATVPAPANDAKPTAPSSSTVAVSKPATPQVVVSQNAAVLPAAQGLSERPAPHWDQHKPGPNDEMVTPADQLTPRPAWCKANGVSDLERAMLPEWFNSSASHRTPASYMQAREKIIKMSDTIANRNVTNSMVRRYIVGDSGSLHRLRQFLVNFGLINEDGINDSSPTPGVLRDNKPTAPKAFDDKLKGNLLDAVVEQSKKRKFDELSTSEADFVPIDWEEVAVQVGHGATSADCEQNFLSLELDGVEESSSPTERPITPDAASAPATTAESSLDASAKDTHDRIRKEMLLNLIETSNGDVVKKVLKASLEATGGDLKKGQAAALLGLTAAKAVEEARNEEAALSTVLSQIVNQRMKKLENRMALLDDVEGIMEAEKVALELERRDLYTARCRHWFGGA